MKVEQRAQAPKPEKKGALGPYDDWNRFSRRWTFRGGLAAGGVWAAGKAFDFAVPGAGTAAAGLILWSGSDHIQLKISEGLQRWREGRAARKELRAAGQLPERGTLFMTPNEIFVPKKAEPRLQELGTRDTYELIA